MNSLRNTPSESSAIMSVMLSKEDSDDPHSLHRNEFDAAPPQTHKSKDTPTRNMNMIVSET